MQANFGLRYQEGGSMAKGQMRSNKEVKKPKKDKSKVAPVVNPLTANIKLSQDKATGGKK